MGRMAPGLKSSKHSSFVRGTLILLALLGAMALPAQEEIPLTRLFDTGTASTTPLTEATVTQREGWKLIAEDTLDHPFAGDAACFNDKVLVVLRKNGSGAEIYAKAAQGFKQRATLGWATTLSVPSSPMARLKTIENSGSAVMLEAALGQNGPAALRLRLTTGESILECRTTDGSGFLEVLSRASCVVVPDYFGDDMVFGSEDFRGRCLPTENLCLNLIAGGEAMLMTVCQTNAQEMWLCDPTPGTPDDLRRQRLGFQKGKSLWLAFLEAPQLWSVGSFPVKQGWRPPFPAQWRVSVLRAGATADSWEFHRGPTPSQAAGPHQGPLLIYPLDRTSDTPLTATCPTDVMRNTLGVGPCQYILACEGMAAQGDPTPNSVMNWVEKQFQQKKEKKAADDIKERLEVMVKHVAEARARITRYQDFASRAQAMLADQPGTETSRAIVADLNRFVAAGLAPAAAPDRARQLAEQVAALIGKENAFAACQELGVQLRALGSVQDSTLARCRMAVRRLKQEGRAMTAPAPSASDPTQAVRALAEQMLQTK